MEFEDVLVEIGDYGKYQRDLILYFLIPSGFFLPWFFLNVFFMLSVPEHWCYVPVLASSNLSVSEQRNLISPPDDPSCSMYDVNYTEILESNVYLIPNKTKTKPCNMGWQYDLSNYDLTAASQWNMVCEDAQDPSFILTLYSVGSILGTPIYGFFADKFGRKKAFFLTLIVTAITGFGSVLVKDYVAFVVLKTINGGLMPCLFQIPYIIVLEIVGPEMRTSMNGISNVSWTVGMCILPLIAWLTRNWILLGLATTSVLLLYFIYWKILPESPRWLVAQERYADAVDILCKIGAKNDMLQDRDILLAKVENLGERIKKEKIIDGVTNSPMDFMRYPRMRKIFLIVTACWTADITAYYGLQLNVPHLGGNEFIDFFLLALAELPGYLACWLFMQRFGRRWCTTSTFMLTGVACMMPGMLPEDTPYIGLISSLVGKFSAAASFMATYQQASELYPTTLRSLGMGLSGTIASAATIPVPYLVYLNKYGKSIPFLIIGSACLVAGFAATFLPETLGENLPQTIYDAEEFGHNQKYFSCAKRRKRSASASHNKNSKNINEKNSNSASAKANNEKTNNADSQTQQNLNAGENAKHENSGITNPAYSSDELDNHVKVEEENATAANKADIKISANNPGFNKQVNPISDFPPVESVDTTLSAYL